MKISHLELISNNLSRFCQASKRVTTISLFGALAVLQPASANDALRSGNSDASAVAIYASYLDADLAAQASQRLEQTLQQPVQLVATQINGSEYLRLQSEPVGPAQARALVSEAKAAGYSAWLSRASNDHTTSVITLDRATPQTSDHLQIQRTTNRDISHLSLAVTEPIPVAGQEISVYSSEVYTAEASTLPSSVMTTSGQPLVSAETSQPYNSLSNHSLHKGARPELEAQLADGPLLGEIYPPRSPQQP